MFKMAVGGSGFRTAQEDNDNPALVGTSEMALSEKEFNTPDIRSPLLQFYVSREPAQGYVYLRFTQLLFVSSCQFIFYIRLCLAEFRLNFCFPSKPSLLALIVEPM